MRFRPRDKEFAGNVLERLASGMSAAAEHLPLTQISVDADAFLVKDEVVRVAQRHGLRVHKVANSWMRLPGNHLVDRVLVTEGADVADG